MRQVEEFGILKSFRLIGKLPKLSSTAHMSAEVVIDGGISKQWCGL